MARRHTPDGIPVLSRGKHRNPRKGACFMEYVSLLAGEKWSDHPKCTHPLLAGVARAVNDCTSDEGRSRLVELIPAVIGLTGDGAAVDLGISMRSAATALPVVADFRQRALAVGLLSARRVLGELDEEGRTLLDDVELTEHVRRALHRAPHAARWAEDFIAGNHFTLKAFRRRSAPTIVRVAVVGISEACIPNRDDLLYELINSVIDDCTRWLGTGTHTDPVRATPILDDETLFSTLRV